MSVRKSNADASAVEEAIVLTRVFDAPRALVFEVWTQAEHFSRWFGPHGAEIVDCELDARPGGIIRFGHRLAEMTLYSKGTFLEVVPNERLVFTLGIVDERGEPVAHPMFSDWPLDMSIETVVTLHDAGDGTRLTLAHRTLPPDVASHPATQRWTPLARLGAAQELDRLGEHLSETRKDRT
jgi:uncharacterized protein YndB with AHSA1/START domain